MIYELLINDIQEVSKDKLKKISMELDNRFFRALKEAYAESLILGGMSPETYKNLLKIEKDRTFYEMLLINALKDDE